MLTAMTYPLRLLCAPCELRNWCVLCGRHGCCWYKDYYLQLSTAASRVDNDVTPIDGCCCCCYTPVTEIPESTSEALSNICDIPAWSSYFPDDTELSYACSKRNDTT